MFSDSRTKSAVKRKFNNVDVGEPEATALFLRFKKRLSIQQSKMLEKRFWLWVAVGLGYFCDSFQSNIL